MSKLKTTIIIIYSSLVAASAVLLTIYFIDPPGDPVISQGGIKTQIIYRDVNSMPDNAIRDGLNSYYTAPPELDIQFIDGNEYLLTAGLCERKWQKTAKIESRSRDSPRNLVVGGVFVDSRLRAGAWGQYYKLYGKVGFGGGVSLCRDYTIVQVAILWMW